MGRPATTSARIAGLAEQNRDALAEKMERGHHALTVMEQHLGRHDYFAGGAYSVAHIALYAYTHVAGEGGFDLSGYPGIEAWLARVAAHQRHVSIYDEVGTPIGG